MVKGGDEGADGELAVRDMGWAAVEDWGVGGIGVGFLTFEHCGGELGCGG